jgi:hypothetical protein
MTLSGKAGAAHWGAGALLSVMIYPYAVKLAREHNAGPYTSSLSSGQLAPREENDDRRQHDPLQKRR